MARSAERRTGERARYPLTYAAVRLAHPIGPMMRRLKWIEADAEASGWSLRRAWRLVWGEARAERAGGKRMRDEGAGEGRPVHSVGPFGDR